jgi:hypothetical protein
LFEQKGFQHVYMQICILLPLTLLCMHVLCVHAHPPVVCLQVNKAGPLKRAVFHGAITLKSLVMRVGVRRLPIVDGVAFGAVRSRLGGRVKLVISGGAPLASHMEHFLRVTMGCPVAQVLTRCELHIALVHNGRGRLPCEGIRAEQCRVSRMRRNVEILLTRFSGASIVTGARR